MNLKWLGPSRYTCPKHLGNRSKNKLVLSAVCFSIVDLYLTVESNVGFVISGRRILTNSHVVDDSYDTYVQVRKHGSSTKYEAIVETVGFECDLAILGVDNEEFWEDVNPLELGDIPSIYEDVSVLGYPRGTFLIKTLLYE